MHTCYVQQLEVCWYSVKLMKNLGTKHHKTVCTYLSSVQFPSHENEQYD